MVQESDRLFELGALVGLVEARIDRPRLAAQRAMADGFDGYMSKPIDFATFVRDVEALLP